MSGCSRGHCVVLCSWRETLLLSVCVQSPGFLLVCSCLCVCVCLCVWLCVCEHVAVKCLFSILPVCSWNSVSYILLYLVAFYVKIHEQPICHLLSLQRESQQHLFLEFCIQKHFCFSFSLSVIKQVWRHNWTSPPPHTHTHNGLR